MDGLAYLPFILIHGVFKFVTKSSQMYSLLLLFIPNCINEAKRKTATQSIKCAQELNIGSPMVTETIKYHLTSVLVQTSPK